MIKFETFNLQNVARRKWIIGFIDDNNIFDADCVRLYKSMLIMRSHHFFVLPIDDLLHSDVLAALKYKTEAESIEHFQNNFDPINNKIYKYEDCLIFSNNLDWAIIRTGEISYTAFAGPPKFVLPIVDPESD